MISIPRHLDRPAGPVVRLIGLGNAGVNLADRMTVAYGGEIEAVALNTDLQSLSSSVVSSKVALGPLVTRGLGAGGDPEIGLDAARESQSEIEAAVRGADIVFLCAGLGGGTASGGAGVVAELVKKGGALLIAVVTSPFAFEGRRRASQAIAALDELAEHADAIVHFENDRMAELAEPRAGVSETFAACDDLLCRCLHVIARLVATPGPLAVGLPDLLSVLEGRDAVCLFGTGSASGGNRAYQAVEQALRSPLLDREQLGDENCSMLVHVAGPPDLSFAEISAILDEISKHLSDSALLHLGVSAGGEASDPVVVTVIGKFGRKVTRRETPRATVRKPAAAAARKLEPAPEETPDPVSSESVDVDHTASAEEAPSKPASPAPAVAPLQGEAPKPKKPSTKVRQETLQFEPVARGRFEKIEPTIVEGEDLDVPTFLRRNQKRS